MVREVNGSIISKKKKKNPNLIKKIRITERFHQKFATLSYLLNKRIFMIRMYNNITQYKKKINLISKK